MQFELTDRQVEDFDRKGFLVLRNWIPKALVERLCHASDAAINGALEHRDGHGIATMENEGKVFVLRINDLFLDRDPVFLELLGCPPVMSAARSLVGENPVSIYESLLVKNEGDGAEIKWHRDMGFDREDRIFTFGIYLDEAREGQGALRIIPGSQLSSDDACAIEDKWRSGGLEAVEIEMNPGDVLIHDVMAMHASSPFTGRGLRRTLYFEFRSSAHVERNERFTDEWAGMRHELRKIAEERWRRSVASAPDFDPNQWERDEAAFIAQLYAKRAMIEAGHYCFRNNG